MDLDLNLTIDKKISINIYDQIYLQLKNQILLGELEVGKRLPSVRQMAKLMDVSRHTVSRAYCQLEVEGLVDIYASSGTFVKSNIKHSKAKQTEKLLLMIDELFEKAEELGFDKEEVAKLTYAAMMSNSKPKLKGLFVECNTYALDEYIKDIEEEVDLDVDGCLLSDERLITKEGIDLEQYDVIMTTIGHYAELKSKLRKENIYALNFGPYLSVIDQIKQLDEQINITIICVTKEGSDGLLNLLVDFGIPESKLDSIGMENGKEVDELKRKIETSDVLVVSKFALLKDRELFENSGKRVIEYGNVLQRTSVNMIKEIIKMYEC